MAIPIRNAAGGKGANGANRGGGAPLLPVNLQHLRGVTLFRLAKPRQDLQLRSTVPREVR